MGNVTFIRPDGSRASAGMCDRQLNLLAHAQMIELDIGSECGGHGVCGKDRLRLKDQSHVSPPTEEERQHLTPEELSQGVRLGCQCFPDKNDVSIEAYVFK